MGEPRDVRPEAAIRRWLFAISALEHVALAAAVPALGLGRAAGAMAAIDAVVAVVALIGAGLSALAPRRPDWLAAIATSEGLVLAIVGSSAFASAARAAAAQSAWAAADLCLAVLVLLAVRSRQGLALGLASCWAAGGVALVLGGTTWGRAVQREPLSDGGVAVVLAVVVLGVSCAGLVVHHVLSRLTTAVEQADRRAGEQAVIDPLTGAHNRRGLELVAGPAIEHARRQGEAVHCLYLDLDDFRGLNDRFGRRRGDELLVTVSEALKASVRSTDTVARWTGDEFIVIGPGTGTSPLEMERRVRSRLAALAGGSSAGSPAASPTAPGDAARPAAVPAAAPATSGTPAAEAWTGRVSIGLATLVPWDEGDLDSLLSRAERDMHLRRSLRRQASDRRALAESSKAVPRES